MTSSITITTETKTKTRIRRRRVTHPDPGEIPGNDERHSIHLSRSVAVFDVAERVFEEEGLDLVIVGSTAQQGPFVGDFWKDSKGWGGSDKRFATKKVRIALGAASITFWFAGQQDQARREAAESVYESRRTCYADQGKLKEKPRRAGPLSIGEDDDDGDSDAPVLAEPGIPDEEENGAQ